jgi:hypothetical protein
MDYYFSGSEMKSLEINSFDYKNEFIKNVEAKKLHITGLFTRRAQ